MESLKPRVTFFNYSEGTVAEDVKAAPGFADGRRMTIVGALVMLRPAYIPGQYSFFVNIGIRGIEPQAENKIRLEFGRYDHVIAETPEMHVPLEKDTEELPPDEKHVLIAASFSNVLIEEPGWYWTKVYFNGEPLGSYDIPARQAKRI